MYQKLNEKEVNIKRTISNRLRKYYSWQKENYDLTDEMKSFSTSLIKTSKDMHYSKPDKLFLSAIFQKVEKETLVSNYSMYISMLAEYNPELKELIEFKYKLNYSMKKISLQTYKSLTRLSHSLNIAILLLAVFDRNIDYGIDDYLNFYNQLSENYRIREKEKILRILNEEDTLLVLDEISRLFNIDIDNSTNIDELFLIKDMTNRESLRIIYTFAFLHPKIEFEEEQFMDKAKKTRMSKKLIATIQKSKSQ